MPGSLVKHHVESMIVLPACGACSSLSRRVFGCHSEGDANDVIRV